MAWGYFMLAVIAVVSIFCIQEGDSFDINAAAAKIIEKMNLSADPCEDFSEFACGRFNKETAIPDGESSISTLSALARLNKDTLYDIIVNTNDTVQSKYLSNIRRFYTSCMNEDKIEELGMKPVLNNSIFALDWPTLNPAWNGTKFNLTDLIARYMKVSVDPILTFGIFNDLKDSTKSIIYLFDRVSTLPQETFLGPRNHSDLQAYQKYLADIAVAMNVSREVADRDAEDVVSLEIELTKIMTPREDQGDYSALYHKVNLGTLSRRYPELQISTALRAVFEMVKICLPDDENVIVFFPSYIGNITSVLRRFSNRTIQNLFAFQYVVQRTDRLNSRMRQIKQDFDRAVNGIANQKPRRQFCVDSTSEGFWLGLSKQFVTRKFSESAKHDVNVMIDILVREFTFVIQLATWMSNTTKLQALEKLRAMTRKIAYPDKNFTEADIDKFYEKYNMNADDYFDNQEEAKYFEFINNLASLRKPLDKTQWKPPLVPYEVDAFNDLLNNQITFLAGIIRAPYFSLSAPHYLNYGALGSVIGHEIFHGFDHQGRTFDANGNSRDWWTAEDNANFKNRSQCIIDSVSATHVDEINMNLNGVATQGESLSDIGGVQEAYKAYRKLLNLCGEEPTLPGLQLNTDQLFFLSWAQIWCEKSTTESLILKVTTQPHLPGKYRIYAALQNSRDFSEAYNCTHRHFMNPRQKCGVW